MKRVVVLLGCAVLILVVAVPVGLSGGKGNPILDAAKEQLSEPTKPFTLVVILNVKEGQGKAFEKMFHPCIKATRKEKGCIAYDLNRDSKDATKYYVYERWQSLAALEHHMQTEHIKTLLSQVGDVLASPPEAKFFAIAAE